MHVVLGMATLCGLVLAAAVLLRALPAVTRAVLGDDPPERAAALDGLRGILALCVFLHHAVMTHAAYGTGTWAVPESNFDNLLGRVGVSLFFMISAYLFWGRVVRNDGRMRWASFFYGRILRLVPMFLVAVALLFLIVAAESDFTLRVTVPELASELASWMGFGFFGAPDINEISALHILGVVWTLEYEWIFYFSLPVLALAYARGRRAWPIYAAIVAISMTDGRIMYVFFATGCVAVHIMAMGPPSRIVRVLWALAGLVSMIALCSLFHDTEGPLQALLLLPAFIAALQGAGPWRVLSSRPLRFLGHISYSVYLLHVPLITILAGWGIGYSAYAALDLYQFYGVALAMGVAIIAVSTLTFIAVEKPFLARRRVAGGTLPYPREPSPAPLSRPGDAGAAVR
jgi:peptidoglycan/LPS O-acetylase OafA/YrhL